MGLLSALVLTICAALSFAYDHDDYQQAIERWNSTAWISTDGKTLYLPDDPRRATLPYADKYCSFHERWATAFTMLSISLVLVVVLSAAISQASFREPQARKLEPATLVRWWAFMRFLMYSFVTLVIGIIQTCLTINSQLLLFLPACRARLWSLPFRLRAALDMLTGQNTGVDDPNTFYSTNVRATTSHLCSVCKGYSLCNNRNSDLKSFRCSRKGPAPTSYFTAHCVDLYHPSYQTKNCQSWERARTCFARGLRPPPTMVTMPFACDSPAVMTLKRSPKVDII